jgi:predicted RNase H-like HicB family nuclease
MITSYLDAAMRKAHIVYLEEDELYAGTIPGLQGVIAAGMTEEECRSELRGALEAWLLVSLTRNLPVPDIDGVTLALRDAV